MSKKVVEKEKGVCRDCVNVTIQTRFSTLSVEGKPTLGRCPFYTDGKWCMVLSRPGCEHYKKRK